MTKTTLIQKIILYNSPSAWATSIDRISQGRSVSFPGWIIDYKIPNPGEDYQNAKFACEHYFMDYIPYTGKFGLFKQEQKFYRRSATAWGNPKCVVKDFAWVEGSQQQQLEQALYVTFRYKRSFQAFRKKYGAGTQEDAYKFWISHNGTHRFNNNFDTSVVQSIQDRIRAAGFPVA